MARRIATTVTPPSWLLEPAPVEVVATIELKRISSRDAWHPAHAVTWIPDGSRDRVEVGVIRRVDTPRSRPLHPDYAYQAWLPGDWRRRTEPADGRGHFPQPVAVKPRQIDAAAVLIIIAHHERGEG